MPRQDETKQQWSKQTTVPTTPRERIRALLNSPLGSLAWANPLRLGPFTIQDFWNVRREKDSYSNNWPDTSQMAQLMLDTGLTVDQIDTAVHVERTDRDRGLTALMQLHRQLRQHFNLSTDYKDGLGCLTTIFEAAHNRPLGQSDVGAALKSHLRTPNQWEIALQCLVQYDNSEEAQNAYLNSIVEALNPVKEKSAGALPERGRRRFFEEEDPYHYGWDSTGSTMVQTLSNVDNRKLVKFLHDKHDIHGLGAMVVQNRLPLSEFLELVAAPAKTPMPTRADQYNQERAPHQFHALNAVETTTTLLEMLNPNEVSSQVRIALASNPSLGDSLQGLVSLPEAKPDNSTAVSAWWNWNMRLHEARLVDYAKPSPALQTALDGLAALQPYLRAGRETVAYMPPEQFDAGFNDLAASHSVLANTALLMLMRSVPNHQNKPSEIWERIKAMDLRWLAQANCADAMTDKWLSNSISYSDKSNLPFTAMVLPRMSALDQARLAPTIAYSIGVNSITGLSPTTLRTMWKEHNPDAFKATIPKQYTNDTYILYALTRKNADELLATLLSMDVRHNPTLYREYVENWTRQAFNVAPAIEEIGPTDNLFGV